MVKKLKDPAKYFKDKAKEEIHNTALALAEVTVDQTAKDAHLIPLSAKKAALETKIIKELGHFQKKIEDGVLQIMTTLSELARHDEKFLSSSMADDVARILAFAYNLKSDSLHYFEELQKDKCLQEICGISEETLQKFYWAAKQIYEEKRFEEAADAFSVLTLLNPHIHAFWMGLGNAQYHSHQYESALYAFAFACQQEPSDPFCQLLSCRCYEALKEYDNAVNALDLALHCLTERTEFAHLKPSIEKEKVRLSQKM